MSTVAERFWSKVNMNGPAPNYNPSLGPCWLWLGSQKGTGYGDIHIRGKKVWAHRWSYADAYGSIPPKAQLDHLCRVRSCVRPSHLEPVTQRVNLLRGNGFSAINAKKDTCPEGHPLSGDNLRPRPQGWREWLVCSRVKALARYYANKPKTPMQPIDINVILDTIGPAA